MSGKASAVLWLGFLLIAAQFFFGGQFSILLGNITATGPKNSPSKNPIGGGGGATPRTVSTA